MSDININITPSDSGQINLDNLRNVQTEYGNIDVSEYIDPSRMDSVESFNVTSDQNVRVSGRIEITQTDTGYKIVIKLDPADPDLHANLANSGSAIDPKQTGWFSVSFVAAFSSVLAEVLSNLRKVGLMEADLERKTRQDIMSLAKDTAELVKQNYAVQAQEQQMQAIQSFVSAGMSSLQLGMNAMNARKAQSDADAAFKDKFDAANKKLKDAKEVAVGKGIADIENDADVLKAKGELSSLQLEKSQYQNNKLHQLDQLTGTFMGVIQNSAKGATEMAIASLKTEQGRIESERTINQSYKDIVDKYNSELAKRRDEAIRSISDWISSAKDMLHAYHQAGLLGH